MKKYSLYRTNINRSRECSKSGSTKCRQPVTISLSKLSSRQHFDHRRGKRNNAIESCGDCSWFYQGYIIIYNTGIYRKSGLPSANWKKYYIVVLFVVTSAVNFCLYLEILWTSRSPNWELDPGEIHGKVEVRRSRGKSPMRWTDSVTGIWNFGVQGCPREWMSNHPQ